MNILYVSAWVGPYKQIWLDECKNKGNSVGTISSCREFCVDNFGCNAFNYNQETGECVLRKCPSPVPKPRHDYTTFRGYAMRIPRKGKLK